MAHRKRMSDANVTNILVQLGRVSTFDPEHLSNSTIRSIASHISVLKRNKIEITEKALTYNVHKMLDRLTDSNGAKLKMGYKRQIGMTIKRLYPHSRIDLSPYNVTRKSQARTRLSTPQFTQNIRRLIESASEYLQSVYSHPTIEDMGMYDTCNAIILSCSTSMRIGELFQLRYSDLEQVVNNEHININSKRHRGPRMVAINDLLRSLIEGLNDTRPKILPVISERIDKQIRMSQMVRYEYDYILISSVDYMRKKLHVLAATNHLMIPKLGFNSFRKYITTTLIEGGAHAVAQSMNNHSSLNMTLDHYNVLGPQTLEKTYNDLLGEKVPPEMLQPEPSYVTVEEVRRQEQKQARQQQKQKQMNTIPKQPAQPQKRLIRTSNDQTHIMSTDLRTNSLLVPEQMYSLRPTKYPSNDTRDSGVGTILDPIPTPSTNNYDNDDEDEYEEYEEDVDMPSFKSVDNNTRQTNTLQSLHDELARYK